MVSSPEKQSFRIIVTTFSQTHLTDQLLAWFDQHHRDLPWRDAACGKRNPYRVWLAEIMLQQTTVTAVIPYYLNFLSKWPTVKAMAEAEDKDIMRAWAGLGYYARARNMVKCARFIADQCQGAFPRAAQDLLKLPGIGPYTAAAVSAIAFNGASAPVDGNVIRTLSRLYALDALMPKNKDQIQRKATALLPQDRSGDFAEALMDLGSQVCRPKNPDCQACPWIKSCQAYAGNVVLEFPKKAPKKLKPTRRGWAFWITRPNGHVLLEQRPPKGLLGGMMGLPSTPWEEDLASFDRAIKPFSASSCQACSGFIKHTFTHFHLELGIIQVSLEGDVEMAGVWVAPDDLETEALPSVMKKAIAHAQKS